MYKNLWIKRAKMLATPFKLRSTRNVQTWPQLTLNV